MKKIDSVFQLHGPQAGRSLNLGCSVIYTVTGEIKYFDPADTKQSHMAYGWTKKRWLKMSTAFRLEFTYDI